LLSLVIFIFWNLKNEKVKDAIKKSMIKIFIALICFSLEYIFYKIENDYDNIIENSFARGAKLYVDKNREKNTLSRTYWKFEVFPRSREDKEKDQGAKSRREGIKSGKEGQWPSRYRFRRGSLFPPCAYGIYTVGSVKSIPDRAVAIPI